MLCFRNLTMLIGDEILYNNPANIIRSFGEKSIVFNQNTFEMFCLSKEGVQILEECNGLSLNDVLRNSYISNLSLQKLIGDYIQFLYTHSLILYKGSILPIEANYKNEKHEELWRFVHKNTGFFFPITGTLEVTYRCNQKCIHCYQDCPSTHTVKEANTELIKKYIYELYKSGCYFLTITGGEPFIRKDIKEIIEYAKSLNFYLTVYTNGTLLKQNDFKFLKSVGINKVCISLFSVNESVHDVIANKKGSQLKALNAIQKLRENEIPVRIHCPILNVNYDYYAEILCLAKELQCEVLLGPTMIPKDDGNLLPLKYSINNKQYFELLINNYSYTKMIDANCNECNYSDGPACNIAFSGISISADGKVFPCNSLKVELGDLNSIPLLEIWRKSVVLENLRNTFMSQVKGCKDCENLTICSPCPANKWKESKKMFGPSILNCRIAKIKKQFFKSLEYEK